MALIFEQKTLLETIKKSLEKNPEVQTEINKLEAYFQSNQYYNDYYAKIMLDAGYQENTATLPKMFSKQSKVIYSKYKPVSLFGKQIGYDHVEIGNTKNALIKDIVKSFFLEYSVYKKLLYKLNNTPRTLDKYKKIFNKIILRKEKAYKIEQLIYAFYAVNKNDVSNFTMTIALNSLKDKLDKKIIELNKEKQKHPNNEQILEDISVFNKVMAKLDKILEPKQEPLLPEKTILDIKNIVKKVITKLDFNNIEILNIKNETISLFPVQVTLLIKDEFNKYYIQKQYEKQSEENFSVIIDLENEEIDNNNNENNTQSL